MQSKLDAGDRPGRLQVGADQPQQAAGHGSRLAAVRSGHQPDDLHLWRSDPVQIGSSILGWNRRSPFCWAATSQAPATVTSVLAATDVVSAPLTCSTPATRSFKFTLTDVVADNASAGAFYLGRCRIAADLIDGPVAARLRRRVDGEVVMTAAGAAVMGHPAASVAWLANQLAGRVRASRPVSWSSPAV